jgi:hypothetical protein
MPIESILIVLLYSAKPYWSMFILLPLILLVSYLITLRSALLNPMQTIAVSVVIGVLTALAAPYLTTSKLAYVTTLADWAALTGIMLVVTCYCWFTLTLLFKGSR